MRAVVLDTGGGIYLDLCVVWTLRVYPNGKCPRVPPAFASLSIQALLWIYDQTTKSGLHVWFASEHPVQSTVPSGFPPPSFFSAGRSPTVVWGSLTEPQACMGLGDPSSNLLMWDREKGAQMGVWNSLPHASRHSIQAWHSLLQLRGGHNRLLRYASRAGSLVIR